ncbi:IS3 family transposase [Xanthomonas campestris]|uniref:IS3 family transposase n=1 Tax=Xanthomonas campestris TaxID=339 RepID=UPI00388EE824
MSSKRYTDEFKIEAVRQVTDRGFKVAEVAERLGVTTHSLYAWLRTFGKSGVVHRAEVDQSAEVRRLKAELRRVTEERDIPKKGRRVLCQGVKAKYAFMQARCGEFRVCAMCRVLRVNRSGYYAWLCSPNSERAKEDDRLLGLIKHHWLASGSVYGHRKITTDLRDLGERCSRHRVHRLMRTEGLRAQVGYGRKPRFHGGMQCKAAANLLDRQFDVTEPDTAWASDFTFIRTHEGWMYLAVVIDLFSRQVVGWAMRDRADTELVVQAVLSAVWRRKPNAGCLVHSDQGSVYTSDDWRSFLASHGLVCSMSRRGNCHDNAPVESFFGLLKRERIRRRTYPTKDAARAEVFDYIEMFYNPNRRHGSIDDLSPVEFERRYAQRGS